MFQLQIPYYHEAVFDRPEIIDIYWNLNSMWQFPDCWQVFKFFFLFYFTLGHYIYFSSETGDVANISSPVEDLSDGCLSFYYNMEGGPSAQLSVYVYRNGVGTLRFVRDGVRVKRDEWVKGQIPVKGGRIYTEFEAYVSSYFSKPGVVAIDDVKYVEGESCPERGICNLNFSPLT